MVGIVLTLAVAVTIVFALFHLLLGVVETVVSDLEIFDYEVFRRLFEKILIVLIALEFNHSLVQVATGQRSIVQVQTVILIGLLVGWCASSSSSRSTPSSPCC